MGAHLHRRCHRVYEIPKFCSSLMLWLNWTIRLLAVLPRARRKAAALHGNRRMYLSNIDTVAAAIHVTTG